MIKHLRHLLKPGRTKMRLASTVVLVMSMSACASLSQRPTDLQPAVVIASEPAKPTAKQNGLWDGCFNDALAAAPGLVPRLAQDCCLSSRVDPDTLAWCRRHQREVGSESTDLQDVASQIAWQRWNREALFCRQLKDLKVHNYMDTNVNDTEIRIQCRISDVMGARFRK